MEKETITQADMARICARVEKRPPMAPYNGNGRRRRPAIGANGSEARSPAGRRCRRTSTARP